MTTTPAAPPHVDEHAAEFSEGDEPAYVLVGEILHITGQDGSTSQHLLVGQGIMRPIRDWELLVVFEFFQTARTESQTREWLAWAGAPPSLLRQFIRHGTLVRVDSRTSWSAARSLRGLRLSAQSVQGSQRPDGYLEVLSQVTGEVVMTVSPELATLLWGNAEGADVPSAIKRMSKVAGESRETIARSALAMAPMLIEHGFARLEWLKVR